MTRTRRSTLACTLLALALAGCALRSGPGPVPEPDILPRAAWGAKDPVLPMKPHTIDHITIHHTGEPSHPERTIEEKLRALQKFSQERSPLEGGRIKEPWPDVPYHYYIDRAGRIAEARPAGYAGDTNTSYDPTGHLLIVVEGNFENEQPTPEQLRSLRRMVRWAAWKWHVPASAIGKHNDYAQTACPGKNLMPELPRLRRMVGR